MTRHGQAPEAPCAVRTRLHGAGWLEEAEVHDPGSAQAGTRSILLLERDASHRRLGGRNLEQHGFRVEFAGDGDELLAIFPRQRFDLVLVGLERASLDAFDVTRALRRIEAECALPRTSILAVVDVHEPGLTVPCLTSGMDGVVQRPLRAETVLAWIPGAGTPPAGAGEAIACDTLDWNDALARLDQDEPLLRELCAIFLRDGETMRRRLLQALADPDLRVLERTAHGLKGAAATLSAHAVGDLARHAEHAARDGADAEARAFGHRLVPALDRLLATLAETSWEREERDAA